MNKAIVLYWSQGGNTEKVASRIQRGLEERGFEVVDEWYVLGEFHGSEENSTVGRMGNIKGLPNEQDLERVQGQARMLASRLGA